MNKEKVVTCNGGIVPSLQHVADRRSDGHKHSPPHLNDARFPRPEPTTAPSMDAAFF
jgi:hypothetical protein